MVHALEQPGLQRLPLDPLRPVDVAESVGEGRLGVTELPAEQGRGGGHQQADAAGVLQRGHAGPSFRGSQVSPVAQFPVASLPRSVAAVPVLDWEPRNRQLGNWTRSIRPATGCRGLAPTRRLLLAGDLADHGPRPHLVGPAVDDRPNAPGSPPRSVTIAAKVRNCQRGKCLRKYSSLLCRVMTRILGEIARFCKGCRWTTLTLGSIFHPPAPAAGPPG